MMQKVNHTTRPIPLYLYAVDSLDPVLTVNPVTAPHDCDVPGCPGPANKRKLEAFPDLLAALERIRMEATGGWEADPAAWMQIIEDTARAAIAKVSPQAR